MRYPPKGLVCQARLGYAPTARKTAQGYPHKVPVKGSIKRTPYGFLLIRSARVGFIEVKF